MANIDNDAFGQNDIAEKYFQNGDPSRALATFQQVFLNHNKATEPQLRAQVARALYGAVRCYESLSNPAMAERIRSTLFARYGRDDNPQTHYWVERARGGNATLPLDFNPAEEFIIDGANHDAKKSSTPESDDKWAKFLADNDLEDDKPINVPNLPPWETPAIPQLIAEKEVTIARIRQILDSAFIEYEQEGNDALRVLQGGSKFFLYLHQPHRLVVVRGYFAFHEHAALEDRMELVNTLNRELILVRFYLDNDGDLTADCTFSYAHGFIPFHLVNTLRLMSEILDVGYSEYDKNDLLR